LLLQRLVVGPLGANCYVVGCAASLEAVVIDPGAEPERILQAAHSHRLNIRALLLTHGHLDHMAAARAVSEAAGAPIYAHPADSEGLLRPSAEFAAMLGIQVQPLQTFESVAEGDQIAVGQLSLRVVATPGHSPGSVCYLAADDLFTGDTLFADGVGRTGPYAALPPGWRPAGPSHLPGGNHEELMRSLRDQLLPLPDHLAVHPGHGPPTTLAQERRHNPWLLACNT